MSTIYDSPDGKDCASKTVTTTVLAAKVGAIWSFTDMILRTKPTNAAAFARTFVYWTGPAAAMGATFASVSCLVGEMRGKDSALNHSAGAAAAMAVYGARYGLRAGCLAAIPLAALAGVLKQVKVSGANIFPDSSLIRKEYGGWDHYKRHYGPRTEVKEPTNY